MFDVTTGKNAQVSNNQSTRGRNPNLALEKKRAWAKPSVGDGLENYRFLTFWRAHRYPNVFALPKGGILRGFPNSTKSRALAWAGASLLPAVAVLSVIPLRHRRKIALQRSQPREDKVLYHRALSKSEQESHQRVCGLAIS